MLSEPNISYKPFWGICRPLNSWRANSPNPIQIYCAFLRISNQMRDYYAKKIKDSFQEFNFSPNEISILIVLKNNSTITTSTELKVVLGVSKTLISRSVDSLEKKGLICTCIDEKDSRIHHLQLTGECKTILKIIDEEIGKINKTLFNDVSVEEMKSLKQTMSKLQKCVEKEE